MVSLASGASLSVGSSSAADVLPSGTGRFFGRPRGRPVALERGGRTRTGRGGSGTSTGGMDAAIITESSLPIEDEGCDKGVGWIGLAFEKDPDLTGATDWREFGRDAACEAGLETG